MNILYVNDNDLAGRRFNGYDLQIMLNDIKGYSAKQVVVSKASDNPNVLPLVCDEWSKFLRERCKDFERRISMQSVIYPFGERIFELEEFEKADIVHFHLIFNQYLSIFSFRDLAKKKPTIWTLHDPWAITGHCVYPVDCKGWLTGCKKCPNLDRYSPLGEDNASEIWQIKNKVYKDIDIDVIVASEWMYQLVTQSPLGKHFKRIHLIPFGIDLELFKRRNREKIRQSLGIKKNDFVIMFRQDNQEWKGLVYIREMLEKLDVKKDIVIITVGTTKLLEDLKNKYKIIENEWVNDDNKMVDLYSASDLFLMPSVAEAFGLMAIESMACSIPVIVFNGTSLPKVTFSPKCGIAIDKGDTAKFVKEVTELVENPDKGVQRGEVGRKLAEKYYDIKRYHKEIISLYKSIYKRGKENAKHK